MPTLKQVGTRFIEAPTPVYDSAAWIEDYLDLDEPEEELKKIDDELDEMLDEFMNDSKRDKVPDSIKRAFPHYIDWSF